MASYIDPALGQIGSGTITQLAGIDRYKFYRRPVLPALSTLPAAAVLAPTATTNPLQPPPAEEAPAAARTFGTQTDYRESEAQTDPYTPDYIVPTGSDPEVLALAGMKWGESLPAGAPELVRIDRLRSRRAAAEALPPLTDDAAFVARRHMLEKMEQTQWGEREADVQVAHEKRMQTLVDAFSQREEEQGRLREDRLSDARRKKALQLDESLTNIQRRRVQTLRKLADQRKVVPGTTEKYGRRDIVGDYSNFGSSIYAPIARQGTRPETRALNYDEATQYLTQTVPGLFELDQTLPKRSGTAVSRDSGLKLTSSQRLSNTNKTVSKRVQRQAAGDLERVASSLDNDGRAKAAPQPPLSRQLMERPPDRPTTPTAPAPSSVDPREQAALFLERLLRGHAAQIQMFHGKERRIELLDELRAAAAVPPPPATRTHRDAAAQAVLDGVAGLLIGQTLDFLAKQLVRSEQHKRSVTLAHQAEVLRRAREDEEAGTRQRELRARAQADEQFRQLSRVHTSSADSYVDAALNAAVDEASAERAHSQATSLAPEAEEGTGGEAVMAFLIPHVAREAQRRADHSTEMRFAKAAKDALFVAVRGPTR
eukprot:TRINITY_DN4212_c0_g1_i1.p1 TRINITY_DN4212_c0_g1~~TRINITY_DN4212_c0_g1_i1.p1  ORF type:complete len:597 (-),score=156.75 TRINITY_DN4212_c0_g1_i1:18-1808(-)